MVKLNLERPGDYNFVRATGPKGIRIGTTNYRDSLLISADHLDSTWPPRTVAGLRLSHLESLFDLKPEVALLGTGKAQEFLPRELQLEVYRLGITLEVMDTAAACRTFNLLVSDGRKVAAGLMPINPA